MHAPVCPRGVAKALSGSGAVLRLPCAQAAAQQQRQYLRGGVGAPVRQQHQQRHQQHRPAVHVACSVVGHQPSSSSERDDGAGRRAGNSARHQASPSSAPFISSQQQQQAFADQQPLQPYTPPAWHPRLFGVPRSKRACLEAAATQYYSEVWNGCSVELLDELASDAVCYNDALGLESDAFSRASLKAVVREFQASHPLLHYDVEDVIVDTERDTVVVHYTVTAAHLLPQQPGLELATGHVSVVSGMDKLHFSKSGLISSIVSFRQRFTEEEVQAIDWSDE